MKIAMDCFNFVGLQGGSGGAGGYTLSLIENLSRMAEVKVICSSRNVGLFNDFQIEHPNVELVPIDSHQEICEALVGKVEILHVPCTEIPNSRPSGSPRIVSTIHDLQHYYMRHFFPQQERVARDNVYFEAATGADGIITCSQAERENIIKAYGPSAPISVIGCAPYSVEWVNRAYSDTIKNAYPPVEKYGSYIYYPAVDWPHKNHFRLIQAFEILSNEFGFKDLKLVLSGAECVEPRQEYRAAYRDLLATPSLAGRIIRLGFISARDVYLHIRSATALVFPSLYEGFGVPMVEAMRLRTPVIASNLPVWEEWFGGCFVPLHDPRNTYSMAKEISTALSNPHASEELAAVGYERSMAFSSEKMAQQTFDFYKQVLTMNAVSGWTPERNLSFIVSSTHNCVLLVDALNPDSVDQKLFIKAIESVSKEAKKRGVSVVLVASTKAPIESLGRGFEVIFVNPDRSEQLETMIKCFVETQVDCPVYCLISAREICAIKSADEFLRQLLNRSSVTGDEVNFTSMSALDDTKKWAFETGSESAFVSLPHSMVLGKSLLLESLGSPFSRLALADFFTRSLARASSPRLAFVEPELRDHVGHHLAVVESICSAAEESGLSTIVATSVDFSKRDERERYVFDRCFKNSYASAIDPLASADTFATELEQFIERHRLTGRDYVYFHMPKPYLILGALQYVVRAPEHRLPSILIRVCSTDETFEWFELRMSKIFKAASELGGRADRFRIFVESIPLQQYFEERTGIQYPVLLNPINGQMLLARQTAAARKSKRVVFGYLGEAREEKGFYLVPEIVEGVLRRLGPDRIEFVIQVSSSNKNETPKIAATKRALRELAERYAATDSIRLIDGLRDMNRYYRAIAQCDAVLLPYEPKAYRVRGSGVALEALAVGSVVIVPAGTDMAVTFDGPGCLVADSWTPEAFVRACEQFVVNRDEFRREAAGRLLSDVLFRPNRPFVEALLSTPKNEAAGGAPAKKVAVWIGNDVINEGCSSTYDAQRAFLRAAGYEIYNIFVPFPDLDGYLHSDVANEKYNTTNALGWREDGYDFGCYSWLLNQRDSDRRRKVMSALKTMTSTKLLWQLNESNILPASLKKFIANRRVDLVCVNYVHLLPVANKMRVGAPIVLETHDLQTENHAVRHKRPVDPEDLDWEMQKLVQADHSIMVSAREFDKVKEFDRSAKLSWILPVPTTTRETRGWLPGSMGLEWDAFAIWTSRPDLQKEFDLRSGASILEFVHWRVFSGRNESEDLRQVSEHLANFLNLGVGTSSLTMIQRWIWKERKDLIEAFPVPEGESRDAYLAWFSEFAGKEYQLNIAGTKVVGEQREDPVCAASLEAVALARPRELCDPGFLQRLRRWTSRKGGIDVLVVGSDHPSNHESISWFMESVVPRLGPNVTVAIAGTVGRLLKPYIGLPNVLALGHVERLDPLYRVTKTVAAPIISGTGIPVKVLDALVRRCALVVTEFCDPGLLLSSAGLPLARDSEEFASDIIALLSSEAERENRRKLIDRYVSARLSSGSYTGGWLKILQDLRLENSGRSQVSPGPLRRIVNLISAAE